MSVLAYLRFVLADDADRERFEDDLEFIGKLAEVQPGYLWGQIGRAPTGDRCYIVVSEWDDVESVRAFEHHPDHEEIIHRWEASYAEEFVHRRFVPWVRPPDAPGGGTA